MDKETENYYNNNAATLQKKYSSTTPGYTDLFKTLYKEGNSALDIGSGSGRDLINLMQAGFNSYGLENSYSLIESSTSYYPSLKSRVLKGNLPGLIPKEIMDKKWDLILLGGILQHIPDSKLLKSLKIVHKLLNSGGKLIISIPMEYPGISSNRDSNGRLFILRKKMEYILILEKLGFSLIDEYQSDDSLGRKGVIWKTLLLESY